MTSYLVTIVTDRHWTWINKQLLKTLDANDWSLRKNSQNLFVGGGGGGAVIFMMQANRIEDANIIYSEHWQDTGNLKYM